MASAKPSRKPSALMRDLADRIRRDYLEAPGNGSPFPPVRELCLRYRVSRPTLLGAAHILREEGRLEFHHGSRMKSAAPPVSQGGGAGLPTNPPIPAQSG